MPQLHLYVPQRTAETLRRRAENRGLSLSRSLTEVVEREAGVADGWPADYFDRIVGGWSGEPLERPEQGSLEEREPIDG